MYYNQPSDGSLTRLVDLASVGKVVMNGIVGVMPAIQITFYDIEPNNILALGFDLSLKITDEETLKLVAIGECLDAIGIDFPRITEEEFYKIPYLFTYNNNTYEYEEAQTWGEWVNSSYNTIGAYIGVPEGFSEEYIMIGSNLVIIN